MQIDPYIHLYVQLGIDIGRPLRTEIVHVQNRYYAKISWKGSRMFSIIVH